jgi:hypothetical protein
LTYRRNLWSCVHFHPSPSFLLNDFPALVGHVSHSRADISDFWVAVIFK